MIKVLVTNDDGIDALGIRTLVEALAPLADVYVAAPADQQSAKSHSITIMRPIKPEKREMEGAVMAYAVDGTPADCVKWGLAKMAEEGIRPDFVFSGINHGMNTGLAAYYSGTVAAAREGALNGIPSIALSVGGHAVFDAKEFDYVAGMIPMLIEMAGSVDPEVIISVNAPELPPHKIKGYKVVETAPFGYGELFDYVQTTGGEYQMMSHPARLGEEIRYDYDAVAARYVAIAPIPTSMTDRVSLSRLKNAYANDEILAVIADAQEDITAELSGRESYERKLATFAGCIRRMDIPLILTRRYEKGEIIEGVGEHYDRCQTVERIQTDAWISEDLIRYTSLIKSSKVILAGAETHIALKQLAEGFLARGYEVTVLDDCSASADDDEHRRAIKDLREAGCIIEGCESMMMRLANEKSSAVRESVERIIKKSRG